jgi:hypothetical protein
LVRAGDRSPGARDLLLEQPQRLVGRSLREQRAERQEAQRRAVRHRADERLQHETDRLVVGELDWGER